MSAQPPKNLCNQLEQLMRSLHTLRQSLQQLAQSNNIANSANKPVESTPVTSELIAQQSTDLLPQFLGILGTLDTADITPAAQQHIRPLQTEAHRRLRLIKTEAMRLRTARQKITIEKSQTQLLEHLNALQQFAEAINQAVCARR